MRGFLARITAVSVFLCLLIVAASTQAITQASYISGSVVTHARRNSAASKRIIKTASRREDAPPSNGDFAQKTLAGLGDIYRGDATWFRPGINYCGGSQSSSEDMIVAASATMFSKWGGETTSELCGQKITLVSGNKAVNATITDECPECSEGSVDMSPAVFRQLADLSAGRLGDLQWAFQTGTPLRLKEADCEE